MLADGGTDVGIITAEIDPAKVAEERRMIPSLTHDRAFADPSSEGAGAGSERMRIKMIASEDQPYYAHPMFWAPFVVVGEGGTFGLQ